MYILYNIYLLFDTFNRIVYVYNFLNTVLKFPHFINNLLFEKFFEKNLGNKEIITRVYKIDVTLGFYTLII